MAPPVASSPSAPASSSRVQPLLVAIIFVLVIVLAAVTFGGNSGFGTSVVVEQSSSANRPPAASSAQQQQKQAAECPPQQVITKEKTIVERVPVPVPVPGPPAPASGIIPTSVKRYAPTLFEAGQVFAKGQTPLTWLKAKREELAKTSPGDTAMSLNQKLAPVSADWQGGYGWVFKKYHPSAYEAAWREEVKPLDGKPGGPLCALVNGKYAKQHQIYIDNLPRMTPNDGGKAECPQGQFPSEPMKFDETVFSRFEYEFKCTFPPCRPESTLDPTGPKVGDIKFTYIEPLVGLLRHPKACNWDILDKNYMLVDPWALVNPSRSDIAPSKPLKVLYFDGGASTWDTGSGGASQSWLHRIYESHCLNFTGWWMWEVTGHNPVNVFQNLPGHVKPGYRWYNIPLTTSPEHWDNPMNHLLIEAKKEDVVIFKIDFDSPAVEAALIQQILDYPEVAELIDEMYFEHHVNQEVLCSPWGMCKGTIYHTDSLKLFTALREKGVRAHSWV